MSKIYFITKNSTKDYSRRQAGGKGHNLYLMSKRGLPVPEWQVIPASAMDDYLLSHGLHSEIESLTEKGSDYKLAEERILELFKKNEFTAVMKEQLIALYKSFNGAVLAVRSSALDEDSAGHSFAGQLSTLLYIQSEREFLNAIRECWASGYSERGLIYRKENQLTMKSIKVAVVVQEMIDPDVSGVLFTADPIHSDPEHLIINSVYGVGEGLVSGLYEGDSYKIQKSEFKVVEEHISEKNKMLTSDPENESTKEVDVQEKLINQSSLNHHQLGELRSLGIRIEEYYHFPQDVEWAIKNGVVYLLQSRPITTGVKNGSGTLWVWDNSNIVESYGGLTMPLTFGFAHYVYHQVYVQFCEVLMVPYKHIRQMDHFLKNMLGLFYGRVYYNLLNWYKLTSILPGYKFNRGFMETMMGTNESLASEIADRVKPPTFHHTPGAKFRSFLVGLKFLSFHFRIQTIVDNFLNEFHPTYEKFRHHDYSSMASDKIYEYYRQLEVEMLWKWHAPIINDFLCMVHFGIFKKLTEKWLSHLGANFHNDLLAGNGNLESAEPTKELIRMAGEVVKTQGLKELLFESANIDCLEVLKSSPYQKFAARVDRYIDKYGFRCMSEMKLEQKDLHQDPSLLFIFLKNIINAGQTDLEIYEKREREIRERAERELTKTLSGIKGMIYRWSLRHARKAVMNRENTRFCRTRIYGVVRAMFYGMGDDFTKRGIIDAPEDIFYLTMAEMNGVFEGTNTTQELRPIIDIRKAQYKEYEDLEPSPRFMTRGPVYYQNEHFPPTVHEKIDESKLAPNQMAGLGCCPGVVEGVVKVILSPDDDLVLNGEILVTHRTDPGWIPLYPSASALLVERGGLLSHSAIVAREMGLPTVVSVKDLTKRLKSGMKIRMDGESGLIEILEE